MKSLLKKFPPNYPKAWKIRILLFRVLTIMFVIAAAFLLLGWETAYSIVFAVIALLFLGVLACAVWGMAQAASGRATPWKK